MGSLFIWHRLIVCVHHLKAGYTKMSAAGRHAKALVHPRRGHREPPTMTRAPRTCDSLPLSSGSPRPSLVGCSTTASDSDEPSYVD